MSHRISVAVAACAVLLLGVSGVPAQSPESSANPLIGVWKMNVEASRLQAGRDYVSVRQYEERGGWMYHTIIYGYPRGTGFTFTAVRYDGREYPVYTAETLGTLLSTGAKTPNTVAITRIDADTIRYTDRTYGAITSIGTCRISPDGKTMTETLTEFDPQNKQTFESTLLFEKQ
jgi:hypothetical protein